MQGRSSSICSQERDAGAALQQGGRPPRHLDEHTGARGGSGRGARSGGADRAAFLPNSEINNYGTCSQERLPWCAPPERLAWCAEMAAFFGWSRPLHESLPLAGAALEAGSASEPLGTPVVDVPTQPPFLLETAMDLQGYAETLRVSVPMQTPGPAPALAPSPVEEKEKITAMPVAGWCSFCGWGGGGARSVSCRECAQLCRQGGLCPLGATQLTVTAAPVVRLLGARSRQVSRRHGVALGCCRCSLRRSLPCQ